MGSSAGMTLAHDSPALVSQSAEWFGPSLYNLSLAKKLPALQSETKQTNYPPPFKIKFNPQYQV